MPLNVTVVPGKVFVDGELVVTTSLNALGQPVIVDNRTGGNGSVGAAILAFVAQSFPAAKLAPLDDAYAFAQVQAFNSYLCATVHVNHAHGRRGARWADDPAAIEEMMEASGRKMSRTTRLLQKGLASRRNDGTREGSSPMAWATATASSPVHLM